MPLMSAHMRFICAFSRILFKPGLRYCFAYPPPPPMPLLPQPDADSANPQPLYTLPLAIKSPRVVPSAPDGAALNPLPSCCGRCWTSSCSVRPSRFHTPMLRRCACSCSCHARGCCSRAAAAVAGLWLLCVFLRCAAAESADSVLPSCQSQRLCYLKSVETCRRA